MPQVTGPQDAALRAQYDAIWQRGRIALTMGRTVDDPLPVADGMRWGISAVLRPQSFSNALARCAAEVAALQGPGGVVYRPDHLHLTVQQFEPFRVDVRGDDALLAARRVALQAFAAAAEPPQVTLRGLTASAGGVLLQGWPGVDLQAWRTALRDAMRTHGAPVAGPEAAPDALRTTCHATLSIFGRDVARAAALVAYVEQQRDALFQTCVFDELWLVGYARTATSVTLIEYGRFPFGARAGSSR